MLEAISTKIKYHKVVLKYFQTRSLLSFIVCLFFKKSHFENLVQTDTLLQKNIVEYFYTVIDLLLFISQSTQAIAQKKKKSLNF